MYRTDTIAAISTPQGTGGIGIIRISGDEAFAIAAKLFKGRKDFSLIKSHTISHGKIIDPANGEIIDEVLVTKMDQPHTFTRENVVEINCHGGMVVVKRILEMVVRQGARPAEPGEFTKRAFLNGRIDLSQAEAVIDLICAKTDESSRAALDQLEGKLSLRIKEIRNKLIELLAHIEVTVDYPEHDVEEITGQKVYNETGNIRDKLIKLLNSFERGRILREGISAVIIGRPNVGKSSLMNELAGKTKAIVTDIPGTTRDIIEEYINIEGIPVRLVDTAGIRETEDIVEKIGVESAQRELELADLIIVMLDASAGFGEEEEDILKKTVGKKSIAVINKIDLVEETKIDRLQQKLEGKSVVKMSLKQDSGTDELIKEITGMFSRGELDLSTEPLLTNIRHKELLEKALCSIEEARTAYDSGLTLDCIAIDIKNAAEFLGQITGESVSEDVMHEIFSRFCLGK